MQVLALSDATTVGMWAVNMAVSAGITIVLARVAMSQRKIERDEDARAEEVANLQDKLHQTATKLIDERFRAATHEIGNSVNGFKLVLEEMKVRLQDSEQDLDGLGERNQRIELAIAGKVDQIKDWIRETVPTRGDLDKHERAVAGRIDRLENKVGVMAEQLAVVHEKCK